LYGGAPDYPEHSASAHWGLYPTMSLRTKVLAVQELFPGDSVGYGSTFTADRAMRVGVVACGYADGYPRIADRANGGRGCPVLVNGVRCSTVGRVSMDMLAVYLTPCMELDSQRAAVAAAAGEPDTGSKPPPSHPQGQGLEGAEVVLWGTSAAFPGAALPVDEVALCCQTISYELLCGVALRVPVVVDELTSKEKPPSSAVTAKDEA